MGRTLEAREILGLTEAIPHLQEILNAISQKLDANWPVPAIGHQPRETKPNKATIASLITL